MPRQPNQPEDCQASGGSVNAAGLDGAAPADGSGAAPSVGGAGGDIGDGGANAADRGEPSWSIAQVAGEFGVTHRTVRHYEELGLICPERRGTQRVYHRRDKIRLALILRGKRLGFPLEEIRKIVDMYDDIPGEAGQLQYVLQQVDDRRADLEQRRRDLDDLSEELDEFERRCREDLAAMERSDRPRAT